MVFPLIPREMKFFDLFDRQAQNLVDGAKEFSKIVNASDFTVEAAKRMHDIEHTGDDINHEIVHKLNEVFVTPFDREDILELAGNMDNIIDGMYMITKRVTLYKVQQSTPELKQFAEIIEKGVLSLQQAIKNLRHGAKNMTHTFKCCVEINRLENEGDVVRDHAIAALFADSKDPVSIIKWKEIYEAAETVTDMCENVADTVESILIKNN